MIRIFQLAWPIFIILVMLMALFGVWFYWHFYKLLKTAYPNIYQSLGKPELMSLSAVKNDWLMYKFIWGKKYLTLGDKKLIKQCNFLYVYGIVFWVLLIILIALTIACF